MKEFLAPVALLRGVNIGIMYRIILRMKELDLDRKGLFFSERSVVRK